MLTNHSFFSVRILSVVISLVLVGCGGGGDSGSNSGYDVAITAFNTPATANNTDNINVSLTVRNDGDLLATPATTIYLSFDNTWDFYDTLMTLSIPALTFSSGTSLSDNVSFFVPTNLRTGNYYVLGYMPTLEGTPTVDETPNNNTMANLISITGTVCTIDSDEEDDTLATATSIAVDDVLMHNFCDDPGDWHVFTATGGVTYRITATVIGGGIGAISLDLYNSNVTEPITLVDLTSQIALDFDFTEAEIIWTPPSSGTFYFRAGELFGLSNTGPDTDYQISLSLN